MGEKIGMLFIAVLVLTVFVVFYNVSEKNVEPMTEDVYGGMRGTITNSLDQLP